MTEDEKARMQLFQDKILNRHQFVFNEDDNGGEYLSLTTDIVSNGDPEDLYYNQVMTLQSYGNSASFSLSMNMLSPNVLRKLADELEEAENKAKSILLTLLRKSV